MTLGEVFRRNLQLAVAHSGEPEAAICRRAGVGKDLLRHFFSGRAQSMSVVRAAAIARALNVDLDRLTSPDFSERDLGRSRGMAENEAVPWAPKPAAPGTVAEIAALVAPSARAPETYRMTAAHPAFGIMAGDVLVIDLGREAAAEDLVLVTIPNPESGAQETVLRRFAPPYLISSDPLDARPAILDDGSLPPLRPVVAVLRSAAL